MEAAPPIHQNAAHDDLADTLPPRADVIGTAEASSAQADTALATKAPPVQIAIAVLGLVAFLYFARPVVLPIFLACVA